MTPTPTDTTPAADPSAELLSSAPVESSDSEGFVESIDKLFETPDTPIEADPDKVADPAKEAEAEVVEPDDLKDLSPKSKEGWAKLNARVKELKVFKTKAAELEAQLAARETRVKELEAASAKLAEYDSLVEKSKEYEVKLAATRLEETDEYKQVIVAPAANIREAATRLEQRYKLEGGALIQVLAEVDPAKQNAAASEAAADMNDRDKMQFYQMLDDFSALMVRRDHLTRNSTAALQELESRRQAAEQQKQAATKQQQKEASEKVWSALTKKVPVLTDAAAAAEVKSKAELSEDAPSSPEVSAYRKYAGALLPNLVKVNSALSTEVASLKAALAKYSSATPGAGGGDPKSSEALDSNLSFLEVMERIPS